MLDEGRELVAQEVRRLAPDVVHAHDFYGMMTGGLSVPRVFTVHGFIHEDTRYAGGNFAWARARWWKKHEVAAWAEQPHIISISPYVRERLRGIARGVIHDVENPIAPEAFDVKPIGGGGIFCAAAISPRKNSLGLVRAFARMAARHPAARLVLAGPSPDAAYRAQVEREIDSAGLRSRVDLPGLLSAEEVRGALARADIFALLSFEEGAPMGIAEAMAAGVPVVASNRCGMPYMVQPGATGWLVDPDNPADAARRFSELLADDARRTALGAAARARALERFHPDRVAERTAEIYEQSIFSARSPATIHN